jgi:catechol 2,3-dioxygenase-like lactoylglutathione lyase family enzyme
MKGRPGLDHVAFAVPGRSAVDEAAHILKDAGARILLGPVELDEPGAPYAIRFCGPEGNRLEICASMQEWVGPENPHVAKPTKLGHVLLHSENPGKTVSFYTDVLGLRISDWVEDFFVFLRCGPDHHTTGLTRGPAPSMHHAGYEVTDIEAIKRSADIAWKNDVKSIWGIGRHGLGHNLFIFYPDPDGNIIEIFAELDQIHDEKNYKPLVWTDEDKHGIWNLRIPEGFFEGVRAVGKKANEKSPVEGVKTGGGG